VREREREREEVEEREREEQKGGGESNISPPHILPRNRGEGHALTCSLETEMEL